MPKSPEQKIMELEAKRITHLKVKKSLRALFLPFPPSQGIS